MLWRRLLVGWIAAACSVSGHALETDQYYAWGRPLADSTGAVNARFNLELERAIDGLPERGREADCRKVAAAYRSRMRFILLHEIQIWVWNSKWVDRYPSGGDEQRQYRRTNLYSNHPLIDTGTWMPFTPTLEVDGIRFGTDKLAHLVSSGWTFYSVYRQGLAKGESPAEAERRAVRRGIVEESLILGKLASGVTAIADIESSYAGISFYRDLCDVEDPVLALRDDGWFISRPIDLRLYVTPRWDESYQPSVYTKGRWRKVRPVLESYCPRLADPKVRQMRERYRLRDHRSLVGEMIAERVADGELDDPAQFGIDAVCEGPSRPMRPLEAADNREAEQLPAVDDAQWKERLRVEEADRRHQVLGLPGAQVSYPLAISGSIAGMLTSQPRGWDCTTPCDFRGPFAQLEAGLGGGRLSLGWTRVTGHTDPSGSILTAGFIGTAYKLTALQTWGDLGWVEAGRTYAGLEITVPVAQAKVGLGLLYRVDGDDGRWLVTGGAGWGF